LAAGQTLAADSAAPNQPGRDIKLNWRLAEQMANPKNSTHPNVAEPTRSTAEIWPGQQGVTIQTAPQCTCSMKITDCFCTKQANLRPFYLLRNHETIAFCPKPKQTITWEACYGL